MERPVSEMPVGKDEARGKAKVHVELGQAYFQVGRYGVALDEAKAAIFYDSRYAPAYQLMGMVHMFLEESQIADANFSHALSLAPGDPEIQNSYGWFLCSTGKEAAGIEMLQSAARNPYYQTPTRAYANVGLCQLRLNNDTAAERSFLRAVELDNTNHQAVFHLAGIAYRRGAYEAAKRDQNGLQIMFPAALSVDDTRPLGDLELGLGAGPAQVARDHRHAAASRAAGKPL